MRGLRYTVSAALAALCIGAAAHVAPPEKLIIDADFNEFSDDGQVLVLAAQAHSQGKIRLLGLTLVTGNAWVEEQEPLAIKAMERAGLGQAVPIFAGIDTPLLHDAARLEQEKPYLQSGDGYWGALSHPKPDVTQVPPPSDGPALHTHIQSQHAVDFIIESIRRNPHQVTILEIGPMTNLAIAIRKAPDIVPLIRRVVYMGGAFDVPGNTLPSAEFNIWIDPEAAKIVWRQPIEHIIFPLDVTNMVQPSSDIFKAIARANPALAPIIKAQGADLIGPEPKPVPFWDQVAMAYIADRTLATKVEERWIDVDTDDGPNYGETLSYPHVNANTNYLQKAKIVTAIDLPRFLQYFVSTMELPLPVELPQTDAGTAQR